MSFKATNWAFKVREISPVAKLTLIFLADNHTPDDDTVYFAFSRLCNNCNMSVATLTAALEELQRAGFIKNVRQDIHPHTYIQSDALELCFGEASENLPESPGKKGLENICHFPATDIH